MCICICIYSCVCRCMCVFFFRVDSLTFDVLRKIFEVKKKKIRRGNGECRKLRKTIIIVYIVRQNYTCLVGRVFANGPGDLGSIPGWVIPKIFKIVLDTSLLNTQQYKVKWSNPGKGVVPSPTPQRSSSWKGSLWLPSTKGRQLYLYTDR